MALFWMKCNDCSLEIICLSTAFLKLFEKVGDAEGFLRRDGFRAFQRENHPARLRDNRSQNSGDLRLSTIFGLIEFSH